MSQNTYNLQFDDNQELQIVIPKTKYLPDCRSFAFSLHKAGSSLLTALLQEYCQLLDIPTINLPSILFINGKDEKTVKVTDELKRLLEIDGYCYLGWRNYMDFLDFIDLNRSKNILLVRDPRDRLISYYFSVRQSHVMPPKGDLKNQLIALREKSSRQSPDHTVKNLLPEFTMNQNFYQSKLSPHNTRIYRYEDVIYRKEEWLSDMVAYFGFPYDKKTVAEIAQKHDIRPEAENPDAHIRQVKPGNHKFHLKSGTLKTLDIELNKYLRCYDYLTPENFGTRLVFAREGSESGKALQPLSNG